MTCPSKIDSLKFQRIFVANLVLGHVDRVPGIQKRVQVMVLRWKRVIQVFAMVGVNGNPGHHVQSRVEPEIDREIGNVVF